MKNFKTGKMFIANLKLPSLKLNQVFLRKKTKIAYISLGILSIFTRGQKSPKDGEGGALEKELSLQPDHTISNTVYRKFNLIILRYPLKTKSEC